MIELRRALNAYLKTLHPRVYFQAAPDTAEFPYLVYDITNIFDDGEGQQIITLDIDGWDKPGNGDTTTLENLMSVVNEGLNKKTLTTDKIAVTFYLDSKIPLIEDDPRIKRRKYVYQGRLYERS
jgi:hypothetical protein